jgi:5-methylcytosine-specific restriction endonuclease McrA
MKPPTHRPIHSRSKAEQIRTWSRFHNAFHPRPSAAERGYDKDWHKLRNAFIREHPECRCGAPAQVVDHITSIKADPSRRLDPSNLESLCHACHNKKGRRHDGTLHGRQPWGRQY